MRTPNALVRGTAQRRSQTSFWSMKTARPNGDGAAREFLRIAPPAEYGRLPITLTGRSAKYGRRSTAAASASTTSTDGSPA